jgi:hypothetical protein
VENRNRSPPDYRIRLDAVVSADVYKTLAADEHRA